LKAEVGLAIGEARRAFGPVAGAKLSKWLQDLIVRSLCRGDERLSKIMPHLHTRVNEPCWSPGRMDFCEAPLAWLSPYSNLLQLDYVIGYLAFLPSLSRASICESVEIEVDLVSAATPRRISNMLNQSCSSQVCRAFFGAENSEIKPMENLLT
jgi:hypothetical protein